MKGISFFTFICLQIALPATAAGNDNLAQWAEEQAGREKETVDGVRMFRPAEADGKLMVSDFFDIPGKDKTEILTKAWVFTADNIDRETEAVELSEPDAGRFVVQRSFSAGEGRDEVTFACRLAIQATDGILTFAAYDISAAFKERGILPRTVGLEKLKPEKNKQHKEIIETFSFLNSKFLQEMLRFVETGDCPAVTHWKEIAKGEVVNGMNKTEVKLSVGTPAYVRTSGEKETWRYSNRFVVFFTEKTVSGVSR